MLTKDNILSFSLIVNILNLFSLMVYYYITKELGQLKNTKANTNTDTSTNVGSLIRGLCQEKGITIVELERKCNLGNGSIKRWENGSSPSLKAITQIADSFNVSIDYLAGRTTQKEQFEEWNKKYNVKRLAEEAKLFDRLGKIQTIFSDAELVDFDDRDLKLLKAYVDLLASKKQS